MRRHACVKSATCLGLILALVAPSSALSPVSSLSPALTRIGVAGGVKGKVQAFPPGEKPVGRFLTSGQDLYLNEKIATGPEGSLQVMLLDETVFTIGPNSTMVLDEFIYDPKSGSGKVTATVKKGVFRFVTGQIGHNKPSDMKVKFPVGTMGIRGTIVAGEVTDNKTTAVLLGPGPATNAAGERVGAFSLENRGAKVDVVKPGYETHIDGPNGIPSPPALVAQQKIDSIMGGISLPAGRQDHPAKPLADQSTSATDDSGQGTAGASGDLSTTKQVSTLDTSLDSTQDTASDTFDLDAFIAQNQSSWDDVRTITSGTGQYAGTDSFWLGLCEGGACADANGPHGTIDFVMNVDFGAKTIGGIVAGAATNSRIVISANDANLAHGAINDTVTFNATSFAALTGPAAISGTSASGNTTANVSLLNLTGPASHATAVAVYSDALGTVGAGAVFAPRADCAVAGACK